MARYDTTGPITVARLQAAREFLRQGSSPAKRLPFLVIAREAARLGWPTHFRRDLTRWDRRAMMHRDPAIPFAWAIRETGTHLMLPEQGTGECGWTTYAHAIGSYLGQDVRFYWYDGRGNLEQITEQEAAERCQRVDAALHTARRMGEQLAAARARMEA